MPNFIPEGFRSLADDLGKQRDLLHSQILTQMDALAYPECTVLQPVAEYGQWLEAWKIELVYIHNILGHLSGVATDLSNLLLQYDEATGNAFPVQY
jgi:hypothetical protein